MHKCIFLYLHITPVLISSPQCDKLDNKCHLLTSLVRRRRGSNHWPSSLCWTTEAGLLSRSCWEHKCQDPCSVSIARKYWSFENRAWHLFLMGVADLVIYTIGNSKIVFYPRPINSDLKNDINLFRWQFLQHSKKRHILMWHCRDEVYNKSIHTSRRCVAWDKIKMHFLTYILNVILSSIVGKLWNNNQWIQWIKIIKHQIWPDET